MDRNSYEQLCRDTSLALGLDDTSVLAQGYAVLINDVLFEFVFNEARSSLVILAELGTVAPEDRAGVYENLLTLQLLALDSPAVRFGFNPTRETPLYCVSVVLREQTEAAWLAPFVASVADQIAEWRGTLLAGRVQPPPHLESMMEMLLDDEPEVQHAMRA